VDRAELTRRPPTLWHSVPLHSTATPDSSSLVANLVGNALGHNVTGGHAWVSTAVTDGKAALSVTNRTAHP